MTNRITRRQAGALALAGLAAPAIVRAQADEIVFGASVPLTGVFAFAGIGVHAGLGDCVKMLNEAGGVGGRRVRYVAEDTGYRVEQSVGVFNRIVSQDRPQLYYGDSTGFSKTIYPEVARRGGPLMAGASFATELNDPGKFPLQFMAGPDYSEMFIILLRAIAREKPGARVALVYSDTEFGRDPIPTAERDSAALGLRIVEKIVTPPGSVDVSTEVLKLRRANPDYTIFHGYVLAPIPEFITQAKQIGMRSAFMGTFWSMDNATVARMGDAADGFMGVNPYRYWYERDGNVAMLDRIRTMRPEYQPNAYMQGFTTALLMLEAARRTLAANRDLSGANLKASLNSIRDFDTGGLIGVPVSIPGNSVPVGRVYRFDARAKQMLPASEWIRLDAPRAG